jgi:hypothetical protein
MAAQDEARFRLRPESVDWRQVEDEIVALDRGTSEYLAINPTGSKLWHLLVEGATGADLERHLTNEYAIEPERAQADIVAFLKMLAERGLLVEER